MSKSKSVKLDKKDKNRALLTDTLPGDTPIIFSNDGLYINAHRYGTSSKAATFDIRDSFFQKFLEPQGRATSPLKYKILKNEVSLRTLSLIHPEAQLSMCRLYEEHSETITYLCSLSPMSIRAPKKTGNSFYSKEFEVTNKYKEIDIDTLESELSRRHASSYFAYRGFNRIYKLFDSPTYLNLEKRFSSMWMLDVANCFDSIYTHTIAWAIKNKEFIKLHVRHKNQFGQAFDTLVQRSNNNETNGIPIGPEVSRVFSEIIFQSIDVDIISSLEEKSGLVFHKDYMVLRYVDDYIVFSKSDADSKIISETISDKLSSYNLYVNDNKVKKYRRPLNTEMSNVVVRLKSVLSDFEKKFITMEKKLDERILIPQDIYRPGSLKRNLISNIKCICNDNDAGYEMVSAYVIATFSNKVMKLIDSAKHFKQKEKDEKTGAALQLQYRDTIILFLDLMFFFYSVNPSVPSSYKLSKTIMVADRFFKSKNPRFTPYFRSAIMENTKDLSFGQGGHHNRDGFISLERLNIILATSEFGESYLSPASTFEHFLAKKSELTYFDIVSLLFYFKNHEPYKSLSGRLEEIIEEKLLSKFNLGKDSESAHLFLDVLSCPYVSIKLRETLLNKYYEKIESGVARSKAEISSDLSELENTYWFTRWQDIDLVKLLERKELNQTY